MSGHSKWSTIKRQKGATDIKRGLLFTKLARAITIAARDGASPDANFKLRLAIERARASNMPKDNIDRAIQRASGGEAVEEAMFEGYGPGGFALIAQVVTDNKNRTSQEIKNIFERGGGRLATPGSVLFQFEHVGQLLVKKQPTSVDEQILALIDAGAEDVEGSEDGIEVFVKPQELANTRDKITKLGFEVERAELIYKPKNMFSVSEPEVAKRALAFLDSLGQHDDVQEVFANLDVPSELIS